METPRKTLEERFAAKVSPCPITGCHWWTGAQDRYGFVNVEGKLRGAHVVAWELKHGPVPRGMCVLHHCDQTTCVNDAHLFLGTKAVNSADMVAKGRQARGDRLPQTRLSDERVAAIRARRAEGHTLADVAEEFGVSVAYVSMLAAGHRR